MQHFRLKPIALVLSEATPVPDRVQLFRTGLFQHPRYGKFAITPKILQEIKKNFDENNRGVDIALDYSHNNDSIAAAWIRSLELSEDGKELWAKTDWTPNGKKTVSDKEFRYISPEFHLDYQDPDTGKKFGPMLLGAGLTNRPYIKEMAPAVELTEINEGEDMTIQELEAKIKKLSEDNAALQAEVKKAADVGGGMTPEQMLAKIKELEAQIAALKGEKEMSTKAAEDAKMCAEKEKEFNKMLSEGKVVAAQKESFMKDDFKGFMKLAETPSLKSHGVSGEGVGVDHSKSETPAQDEVISLAEKLVEEKKAKDISIAQGMILHDPKHADLRKRCEKETEV